MGHEDHIKRHLDNLRKIYSQEKISALVKSCGFNPDSVLSASDEQCGRYLKAVSEVFGKTTYHFAAANFIFAGCEVAEAARKE